MRRLFGALIALVLCGPILAGIGVGLFVNPAVIAVGTGLICPGTAFSDDGGAGETPTVPETARIVVPVPAGRYSLTDGFGWRYDPFTGERRFHYGTDFGAADGTPILAAADGVVTVVGTGGGFGNLIVITHTVGGQTVATGYGHMWADGVYVHEGQRVSAGQLIGAVGSSGYSTGAHLHFEVHPGGWSSPAVDGLAWLAAHGAIPIEDAGLAAACSPTPTPTPSGEAA